MAQDMNDRVAAYRGLVESLAAKVVGGTAARRVGAEYDDLVQEGLISIWQALERGVTPSAEIVEFRMKDWLRYLRRQTPMPYEEILPIELVGEHRLDPREANPVRGGDWNTIRLRPRPFKRLQNEVPSVSPRDVAGR